MELAAVVPPEYFSNTQSLAASVVAVSMVKAVLPLPVTPLITMSAPAPFTFSDNAMPVVTKAFSAKLNAKPLVVTAKPMGSGAVVSCI